MGLTVWDTAERYAHGESESTIGAWLASRPPDLTGQIRIATKVAPSSLEGMDGVLFDTDYVQRKLDASLERLGCRRVAMYMAHALCDATPVQQTVEAFVAVIESGRAERIGCCNVGPGQLLAALDAARRFGYPARRGASARKQQRRSGDGMDHRTPRLCSPSGRAVAHGAPPGASAA